MLEIAMMIEGQNGLNWERWKRVAEAVEDLGFAGLYRSDHYTNAEPPDMDSLECWVSLTWLADHTRRIEFGSLVSPLSVREPTMLARQATAVDDLSNGRLTLGLGAGWQEREHEHYGFDLLPPRARLRRFEEGLRVITALLQSDRPVNFDGEYYHVHDAVLLPRPKRPGGPPILVGGNGLQRTLPLAAKYASEWNGTFLAPERYAELNRRLDELIAENGRPPREVRRSLMTGCAFGKTKQKVEQTLAERGRTFEQLRERGIIVGTAPEVIVQLSALAAAGCQRVMLQWLELDDLDGLEALAKSVLPQFKGQGEREMSKKPLDESLERLHTELQRTEAKDEESRRMLLDLQEHTRSAMQQPSPDSQASLQTRLESAVTHFENSHPQLTLTMQQVLDHLANV